MGASNSFETIDMVELGGNLVAKQPTSTARADCPCVDIFWITPYKIAEGTLVRDLLGAGDDTDLVDGPDLGAETAVYTENGAVNDSRQNQEVKNLAASFPDRRVAVFCLTFLVKPIHLSNLPRFVIAAYENNPVWISVV
jgi:hypothetical protein